MIHTPEKLFRKAHTEGPWTSRYSNVYGPLEGQGCVKQILAILKQPAEELLSGEHTIEEANGHLMAAAPDMLEALKTALITLETTIRNAVLEDLPLDWHAENFVEIYCKLRRAIGKAGGFTQETWFWKGWFYCYDCTGAIAGVVREIPVSEIGPGPTDTITCPECGAATCVPDWDVFEGDFGLFAEKPEE